MDYKELKEESDDLDEELMESLEPYIRVMYAIKNNASCDMIARLCARCEGPVEDFEKKYKELESKWDKLDGKSNQPISMESLGMNWKDFM